MTANNRIFVGLSLIAVAAAVILSAANLYLGDLNQDEGWYLFEHYGAMLVHGNPYLKRDGKKEYQQLDALGTRPASHGCIRLPPEEAKWFTSWQPEGAHVIIRALARKF